MRPTSKKLTSSPLSLRFIFSRSALLVFISIHSLEPRALPRAKPRLYSWGFSSVGLPKLHHAGSSSTRHICNNALSANFPDVDRCQRLEPPSFVVIVGADPDGVCPSI